MRLRGRREQPPTDLTAALDAGERVVSWADTADGRVVAVTPLGLWWPEAAGYRRIGWQHVVKATWRDDLLGMVEGEVVDDTLLVDRPPVAVRVTVPRDLPGAVRTRVERNIVERQLVTVPGGAVRFVARRQPGRDGLVWWAHLADDTPDTPQLRRAVAARLQTLRAGDAG